uniref:ShKT domain-containing protein n=1 Tax=Panagrolaimus sp. JU765 TaxID=591449 RepID=A0AC34RLF4_9BILA
MKSVCPKTCRLCFPQFQWEQLKDYVEMTDFRPYTRICFDRYPDCAQYKRLCNVQQFYEVMTTQCAKTCRRCRPINIDTTPNFDIFQTGYGQ